MLDFLKKWNDSIKSKLWNKVITFVFSVWTMVFTTLWQTDKALAQEYYWQELVEELPS